MSKREEWVEHSILIAAETRERALNFSLGSGIHEEVISRCLLHQLCFYTDTCKIRTDNPCVTSLHSRPLHYGAAKLCYTHSILIVAETRERTSSFSYTNGVLIVIRAGFYLTIPVLRVCTLNYLTTTPLNCVAYSITSVSETRDRVLSFSQGSGFYEVVSDCLPHQWYFYWDMCMIQTHNACVMIPKA